MDTKTTLMDTAETLARQRGLDAFSFADLADAAGIRKPSVHYHFRTKAVLARDLITRYHKGIRAELIAIVEAESDPTARLSKFVTLYRDAAEQGSKLCLCASFSACRDGLSDEARSALDAFYDDTLRWLESTFAMMDKKDAKAEAHCLMALVEGAQLMARQRKDIASFDRAVAPYLTNLNLGDA